MRVRATWVVAGSLGLVSLGGLGFIALGLVRWGVCAVALFAFFGLVWLFLLVALLSVDVYRWQSGDGRDE